MQLLSRKVLGAIHEWLKIRKGVREKNNILLAAIFLNQVFSGSFHGVKFCFVVRAQVTSWDGETGDGFIWATDVGTNASTNGSVFWEAICEDIGPGALGIAILQHL